MLWSFFMFDEGAFDTVTVPHIRSFKRLVSTHSYILKLIHGYLGNIYYEVPSVLLLHALQIQSGVPQGSVTVAS